MTFAGAECPILLRLLCLRACGRAGFLAVGSAVGRLNKSLLVVRGLNIRSRGRGTGEVGGRCRL